MNLRTYVYDRTGVPGVSFDSLDANQPLAMTIACRFFHLPYRHAKMKSRRSLGGVIRYEARRPGDSGRRCFFKYAPGNALPEPRPESLEFFLVECYRPYSSAPTGLRRGAVFHRPYPLCRAEVTAWDENLLTLNGFSPTGRAPDHVIMSPGVDVTVFPLESIPQ
jgi:uncharacterized protein